MHKAKEVDTEVAGAPMWALARLVSASVMADEDYCDVSAKY